MAGPIRSDPRWFGADLETETLGLSVLPES
jgi:hypothetical protein